MPGTNEVAELLRQLQEREREQLKDRPPPPPREPATIPCTELAEPLPGSPIAREWDYYRREVVRLLAEGNEGKWILIKGDQIVGIWNTQEEADTVRIERFLLQPVLMKQILSREPILRGGGYFRPWPS